MEGVYLGCALGDAGLREYRLECCSCGQSLSVFTPADGLSRGRSFNVDCPSCGGLHLDVNSLVMSDHGNPQAPLHLNQVMMGGGYVHDFYCLYPQVEGESAEDRKARLVALAAQSCTEADLPEEEIRGLIGQLYDRNPYVLHVAKDVIDDIAKHPEQAELIQEIGPAENGNCVLQRFGFNVTWSAAVVTSPAQAVDLSQVSMGSFAVPVPASGSKKFCSECGAVAVGKFCVECGAVI